MDIYVESQGERRVISTSQTTLGSFLSSPEFTNNFAPPTGCTYLVNGVAANSNKALGRGDTVTWTQPVGTKGSEDEAAAPTTEADETAASTEEAAVS